MARTVLTPTYRTSAETNALLGKTVCRETDMLLAWINRLFVVALLLFSFVASPALWAQAVDPAGRADSESQERLLVLQTLIDNNLLARDELREAIKSADPIELSELQQSLESLSADLKKLRQSFEQAAIGAVDVTLLGDIDTSFNWQTEVSQILQPIVDNLKIITEKPRKLGKLQKIIEQNEIQRETITQALTTIEQNLALSTDAATQTSLAKLALEWERRRADNQQALNIARLQLADLERGDKTWWQALTEALNEFVRERGLTLVLAVLMALIVWFLMFGILRLFQLRVKNENQHDFQTRKRLAQYSYRALTLLLILVAVISVFYVRGDMLLMGLSILAAAAVALGLRQAIPRFINEARILLNLGSVRENERVIYNGLPWEVVSLNMHSVLKNPELRGELRLPLGTVSSLVSRPYRDEPWYPASEGDFIVLDNDQFMCVMRLTPETVELRDRGGTITAVPATEFYQWTFRNLSRGESFGISTVFGIDYRHQSISLNEVPEQLKSAIESALNVGEYAESVLRVQVELQSAASSSLDYWIYVTLAKPAAARYAQAMRLVQQTCVQVCTEQSWGIPFPHLSIQTLDSNA